MYDRAVMLAAVIVSLPSSKKQTNKNLNDLQGEGKHSVMGREVRNWNVLNDAPNPELASKPVAKTISLLGS